MTQNITLANNPDWQQGEIVAENSIRLTSGFHASANDRMHLHTENLDRSMIINEGWEDLFKNNEKTTKINPPETEITETENIKIYPNPTTGTFIIAYKMKQSIKSIEISDISGKIVYTVQNLNNNYIEIDISNFEQGIYLIKITTNSNIYTNKIIKIKIFYIFSANQKKLRFRQKHQNQTSFSINAYCSNIFLKPLIKKNFVFIIFIFYL